jgi:tetratricopeptide (TPR) repeat protein
MGFSDWFHGKDRRGDAEQSLGLDATLERLEAECEKAAAGLQWGPLNRAGDLCLRAGRREQALEYYGRTIDTLLEDGQREAARGVANKIIRVHPTALRTLCTLTWLDLSAGHMATALLHLRDYVEGARKAEREGITASQVLEMARVVPHQEFLGAAADALDQLDYPEKAGAVRAWLQAGGSPDAIEDPEELAATCLAAAVGSNRRPGRPAAEGADPGTGGPERDGPEAAEEERVGGDGSGPDGG